MNLDRIIAVRNNKTVYRDGNKCLKVFNSDYSKANVLNEALNQARIELTGLNIPKVLEVTVIDGKWTIVSEFIKGKSLQQLINDDRENVDKYLEIFVNTQVKMNSMTCSDLNSQSEKMEKSILLTDLNATQRYNLYLKLKNMPESNNICHGDYNPTNIIITDDGIPFIIDWSHVTRGDCCADAAWTYLLFLFNNDTDMANKYLTLFCKKSKNNTACVKNWVSTVAASRLIRCNEAQRNFLYGYVNDEL